MFNRVDSSTYSYSFKDGEDKKKFLIKFKAGEARNSPIYKDTEFKYNLTSKMIKDLIENKTSTYKLGGKTWQIKAKERKSPALSKITNVFHKRGDDGIEHLEIVELTDDRLHGLKANVGALDEADSDYVKNEVDVFNRICAEEYDKAMGLIVPSSSEWTKGIRAKIDLEKEDPFTKLAAIAFQKYETEFTGTDKLNLTQAQYCLQVAGDQLVLASQKNAGSDKEKNRAAFAEYTHQMIQEYGEKKVKEVAYAYGIDLEKMQKEGTPLTPELVYRMNIGLSLTTIDDVRAFAAKLPIFIHAFNTGTRESFPALAEKADLTDREIRGMLAQLTGEQGALKFGDLLRWMEKAQYFPDLSKEDMASIIGVFSYDKQALTGRKIYYEIQTAYTTAGRKENKPWIDDQELLQTFKSLRQPQSEASYFETLSFIVSKKHLMQKDEAKQYAVGSLIPAPPDDEGTPRYYSVAKAVHNGFGGLYYELDPLGEDTGLAKIYLFRSTASDSYAFFSNESVSNDLNPLASIGHEGVFRIENEIMPGIIDATIPVWVGYLEQFKASPALTTARTAFQELLNDQENQVPLYSFADLLKKHDFLLNDLRILGGIGFISFHALANRYIHSLKKPTQEEERTDAQALINTLLKFSPSISSLPIDQQSKMRLNSAMIDFTQEVTDHVLTDKSLKMREAHLQQFEQQNRRSLNNIRQNLANPSDLNRSLKEIKKSLSEISIRLGEDMSQKNPQDLAFTGQSLGGAMSQVYASKFIFNQRRIPCPDQKISVTEFDGPGGSYEDNQQFKSLITKHGEMIQNLGSKIEIYHQHEVGDPAPNTGVHLGAASSIEEAASLLKKCDMKIELFQRLADAKHPTVAQSEMVHATQFLKGSEGVDYKKTTLDPYSLGLFDFCEVMKDTLPEDLVAKGNHLRDRVWQLSLIGRGSGEQLRTSPLLEPFRHYFRQKDSRFNNLSDSNGNFIIDQQGIRTPPVIVLPQDILQPKAIANINQWKIGTEEENLNREQINSPFPSSPHRYSLASDEFQELVGKVNQVAVTLRKQGTTATAPTFLPVLKANVNVDPGQAKEEDVHTVAILKHASEGTPSVKRQAEKWIKSLSFAQETLGMRRPTTLLPGGAAESKAFGEVEAYRLSQFLGSNTVPETHFVHLYPDHHLEVAQLGAPEDVHLTTVQQFAGPGFKDARDDLQEDIKNNRIFKFEGSIKLGTKKSHINLPATEYCFRNDAGNFTKQGLKKFQKCAVDSYIFGGIDCHLGNLLSKKDSHGRYADFALIDNGNSFFTNFPEENDKLILNNYCGWSVHPLAAEPLDEETLQYINTIDPNQVILFLLQQKEETRGYCTVNEKDHAETYFDDPMIINTLIRIQVLKELANRTQQNKLSFATNNELPLNPQEKKVLDKVMNKENTLEKLAELKTENQIVGYLGKKVVDNLRS